MRRPRKRYPWQSWIGAPVAIGLLILGLALGLPSLAPALDSVLGENPDRHFANLGISRIPKIPPPVDFELSDLEGRPVRLSGLKGKVVVINFWTTWCPSCQIEMPDLEKLHQRFKTSDFILLAVDLRESRETVQKYFQRNKLNFTALLDSDGEVAHSFGIRSIPTTFIIDQSGGMVGKAIGARPWGSARALAFFEQLIHNPSPPEQADEKESR